MTDTLQPLTESERTEIQAVLDIANARLAALTGQPGKGLLCSWLIRARTFAANVLETSATYERTLKIDEEVRDRQNALRTQIAELEAELKCNEAAPLTASVPTTSLRQAIINCEVELKELGEKLPAWQMDLHRDRLSQELRNYRELDFSLLEAEEFPAQFEEITKACLVAQDPPNRLRGQPYPWNGRTSEEHIVTTYQGDDSNSDIYPRRF